MSFFERLKVMAGVGGPVAADNRREWAQIERMAGDDSQSRSHQGYREMRLAKCRHRCLHTKH